MNALAIPEDPGEGIAAVTPTDGQGFERKSTRLGAMVEARERQLEAMLAASFAIEYARLVPLADGRAAARYSSTVVDNSRLLSGGNPQRHASLLRHQLRWLRSLPIGSPELR